MVRLGNLVAFAVLMSLPLSCGSSDEAATAISTTTVPTAAVSTAAVSTVPGSTAPSSTTTSSTPLPPKIPVPSLATPGPAVAPRSLPTATDLEESWRRGCPVGPESLSEVSVPYIGFDGAELTGTLIVASSVAEEIEEIFAELFNVRFPIRLIEPVSTFGASDDYSMAFDNTSAFNCRNVAGTSNWSKHSYGIAVDINPLENPWVRTDGRVFPAEGTPFAERSVVATGLITADGPVVDAFTKRGWTWGGTWSEPDYQHFVKR